MIINRIAEILEKRGIGEMRPTEDQLNEMNITLHTWNKWMRKTADPELHHMAAIANFLKCDISEIVIEQTVAA